MSVLTRLRCFQGPSSILLKGISSRRLSSGVGGRDAECDGSNAGSFELGLRDGGGGGDESGLDVGGGVDVASTEGLSETAQGVIGMAQKIASMTTFGEREEPFCWWHPVRFVLREAHELVGLPWWLAIAATTITVRLIASPVLVTSFRFQESMRRVQPQLWDAQNRAKELMREGRKEEAMLENQKAQKIVSDQGGIVKGLLGPLVQMPVFIGMFKTLRSMAEDGEEGFSTGGFGWLTDLARPDASHAAPILTVFATLLMMETNRSQSSGKTSVATTYIGRGFAVMSLLITWKMPVALFFYWIPNAMFSAASVLFMRSPPIYKRIMRSVDDRQKKQELKTRLESSVIAPAAASIKMGDLDAAMTYMSKNSSKASNMDTIHLWARKRKSRRSE